MRHYKRRERVVVSDEYGNKIIVPMSKIRTVVNHEEYGSVIILADGTIEWSSDDPDNLARRMFGRRYRKVRVSREEEAEEEDS